MHSPHVGVAGLALCLGLVGPAAAATYVVDNQSGSCTNSGPGSQAVPFCTISAAAAAHHLPGDTILVMPGTYRERVTVPGSGEPGAPLVFRAQGAGVLLDGADSFASPALWTPDVGTVWRAAGVTWQPLQVFVDGARLTAAAVLPGDLPLRAFTWVDGSGLYVNLGGDDPGTHQTLVGRRKYAFNAATRSWVTIEGFEIERTESRSIFLQSGSTDIVIARNRVSFSNSYGIEVVDGARIFIEQNVVSDGNYHGIGLTAGTYGSVVRGNESFRNSDPAVRRANGIYVYNSSGNTLAGNLLHHNQDSGMFFTGGSGQNVSTNNRSWSNGDHGFDHVDAAANVHTNDVAFGNYKDGFSVEGDSPNTQIFNCIAVDNGLTSDEFDLWVNDLSSVGFVSDYNLFWNSTSQVPFKYVEARYATLADYRAASGQDVHSLQSDPQFANAAAGDFYLRPGSPAIDAGFSGAPSWPDTDAVGDERVDQSSVPDRGAGPVTFADIGALEYLQQVDPDAVEIPNPLGTVGDRSGRRAPYLESAPGQGTPVTAVALSNGYPNPFRGTVEFTLDLPRAARLRWAVFDVQGRLVWSEERTLPPGRANLRWDGSSTGRGHAPTGIYLVHASVEDTRFTRRVVRF